MRGPVEPFIIGKVEAQLSAGVEVGDVAEGTRDLVFSLAQTVVKLLSVAVRIVVGQRLQFAEDVP